MSADRLIDKLIEKGLERLEDQGGEWFDDFVGKARDLTEGMDPEDADFANAAIDSVAERKDSLLHLGKGGLLSVLVSLHLGQEKEARLAFFRVDAEFDELMRESVGNFDSVVEGKLATEAAWEDLKEMAKELGALLLRALPLLLAA